MKKLIRTAAAVAGLSGLAGCVTASERLNATQDKTCQQWGFKPGTPAYGNCRLELSRQAAAMEAVQAAANAQTAAALYPPPALLHQPQTCNYSGSTIGGISSGSLWCP